MVYICVSGRSLFISLIFAFKKKILITCGENSKIYFMSIQLVHICQKIFFVFFKHYFFFHLFVLHLSLIFWLSFHSNQNIPFWYINRYTIYLIFLSLSKVRSLNWPFGQNFGMKWDLTLWIRVWGLETPHLRGPLL